MSHLDFNKFYEANSTQIENQYKLASGIHSVVTPADSGKINDPDSYVWDKTAQKYTTNGNNSLLNDGLIAPMQSFLVIPKVNNPQLVATTEVMTTSVAPENGLRTGVRQHPANLLEIFAVRGGEQKKVLLLYRSGASPEYRPDEDSRKLFPASDTLPVSVYMRSPDGYALDINFTGSLEEPVALGVRTALAGEITLRFAGMESFDGNLRIKLHDVQANRVIDLSGQAEYTFTKEASDPLYLENRFYLSFDSRTAIDIPGYPEYAGISVTHNRREIQILSNDGNPLGRIRIFDLQGRTLLDVRSQASAYFYPVRQAGVYMLRVENQGGNETR